MKITAAAYQRHSWSLCTREFRRAEKTATTVNVSLAHDYTVALLLTYGLPGSKAWSISEEDFKAISLMASRFEPALIIHGGVRDWRDTVRQKLHAEQPLIWSCK